MEIKKQEEINIKEIANKMEEGKVVVYPTETCYGLGCDATNQNAVDKVFAIKQRQKNKPVLVLVSDLDIIVDYIEWTPKLDELSQKYWPGALTAVVKLIDEHPFAKGVVGEDNTLAFRVTAHPLAGGISKAIKKPIVSTSANLAEQGNSYDIENIVSAFSDKESQPDIIIDAGQLSNESPSTIVKVDGDKLTTLRQGEVVVDL